MGNVPRQCPICQKFFLTTNASQAEKIIGWDEKARAILEDIIPDGKGSLNHLVRNHWKRKAIHEALEKLSWREQAENKNAAATCRYRADHDGE